MPQDQFSALELLLDDGSLDDPTKRAAMGAQLRRQNAMGVVGQLMGVQPTQMAGQNLQQGAETSLKMAMSQRQAAKEAAARESERKQAQANWQAQQEREARRDAEQRRQFGVQEARLASAQSQEGKKQWAAIADPITGQVILYNQFTGQKLNSDGSPYGSGQGAPQQAPTPPGGVSAGPAPLGMGTGMGKPPTESETKAGLMGGVGAGNLGAAQSIINKNPGAAKPGFLETGATLFGMQPEAQTLMTQLGGGTDRAAVRSNIENFIDTSLTAITGAAYTPAQLATYRAQYMPTILDTAASRKQKSEAMVRFVREQSRAAGRAWTPEREQQLQGLVQAINLGSDPGMQPGATPQQMLDVPGPQQPQGPRPGDKYLGGQ